MTERSYKLFWLLIVNLIFLEIKELNAIQVLSVDVPPKVKDGRSEISLECHFDLQGKNLYSLNWWKDHQQFYQFSPTTAGNKQTHETYGIEVVEAESNLKRVTLRNVTKATSGEFKCEVVADYPSYERDSLSASMEVIEVPNAAPFISLGRIHYRVGDIMEANCSSPGSKPPPSLSWQINGKEIPARAHFVSSRSKKHFVSLRNISSWDSLENNLESDLFSGSVASVTFGGTVTSDVLVLMKPIHFMHEGRATLTCVASIPNVYRSATSVHLALPGIVPLEPSLRISNSQMNEAFSPLQICLIIILINSSPTSIFDLKLNFISGNYYLVS